MPEFGDLIGVDGATGDHGCTDHAVLRWLGGNRAEVVQAESCTSCWQVGHDADHIFAAVGEVWLVDPSRLRRQPDNWNEEWGWSTDVKWEMVV